MELKGKKIAFLGDSITEGVGVSSIEHVYWNLVGQRTGAEVYGYGIGGTRIAVNRQPNQTPFVEEGYFSARAEKMIPDADIVVVFGGTNDFGHGDAPLGTIYDRMVDTFYGGYHILMQKLIRRYPRAQLIVMTPMHRVSEEIEAKATLKRYVEAVREIAEFYSVPVVDLFAESGIQPGVDIQKEMYMPDGLHPNDAGHIKIADCLLRVLDRL